MRLMIIMRGIPGSGKSTRADSLGEYYAEQGKTVITCSADDFFMKGGKYVFKRQELGMAHAYCYNRARRACEREVDVIIIDNTNVKKRDYRRYVDLAKERRYDVRYEIMPCDSEEEALFFNTRSVHNVPPEVNLRMFQSWES